MLKYYILVATVWHAYKIHVTPKNKKYLMNNFYAEFFFDDFYFNFSFGLMMMVMGI